MARTFSHRQTKRGRRPFPQTQAFIGSNDLVFINPVRSQIVGIQIVLIRRSVHTMQMRNRLAFGPRSSSFIRIYFSRQQSSIGRDGENTYASAVVVSRDSHPAFTVHPDITGSAAIRLLFIQQGKCPGMFIKRIGTYFRVRHSSFTYRIDKLAIPAHCQIRRILNARQAFHRHSRPFLHIEAKQIYTRVCSIRIRSDKQK